MTAEDLIAFEAEVAEAFKARRVRGPIHLSGGNELQLLGIFEHISREDWICSTYRNHYHALLHGIPREEVMELILAGHSMNLSFPEHRFLTSAIVGGMLPIAVGIAAALKRQRSQRRVFCFVGDMAASIGAFHDAEKFAAGQRLPIIFVVENNGLSCDSPTAACWGDGGGADSIHYRYIRTYPHVGVGEFVQF